MKAPSRGIKGAVLAALVEHPGLTVAEYAAMVAPERPRFAGPVLGAADWRRRQDARSAWAEAVEVLRPAVSRSMRRLASEGWALPATVARVTPCGRAALHRAEGCPELAATRALRLAILAGELPREARQLDVAAAARILSALRFRETGRTATANRLGIDPAGHGFRSAWEAGATLGLWWLPQHRLPSDAAVRALGALSPFEPAPDLREPLRAPQGPVLGALGAA